MVWPASMGSGPEGRNQVALKVAVSDGWNPQWGPALKAGISHGAGGHGNVYRLRVSMGSGREGRNQACRG